MKLSRPAYIAFVAYVMMAIVILLPFNIKPALDPNNETDISTKYVFAQRLFLVLMMVIPFALSVYSINCFVVGKCWTWSYINAVLIVVWVLLFLLGTVISSQSQIELYSNCAYNNKQ
jgi:hypothetical protein